MAKRKRLRRWLIAAFVVISLFIAALATRIPQESVTRFAVNRILGVTAEVEWSSKWWTLGIDRLALFAPNESEPVIEIAGVRAGWDEIDSTRYRKIDIDRLTLRPRLSRDKSHNLQWLIDFLDRQKQESAAGSKSNYSVGFHRIDLNGVWPDGNIDIQSFAAHVEFGGAGISKVVVQHIPASDIADAPSTMDISLQYKGEVKKWSHSWFQSMFVVDEDLVATYLSLRMGEDIDISGNFLRSLDFGSRVGDEIQVGTFRVAGTAVPQALKSEYGLDFDFEELSIDPFIVNFARFPESFPDANFLASITELSLGQEHRSFYSGDLEIQAKLRRETEGVDITATFPEEQSAYFELSKLDDGLTIDANLSDWSREQWINVLPEEFRDAFATLDMDSVDGTVRVQRDDGFEISGELKAESDSGEEPFALAFEFAGDDSNWRGMTGWAESRMGDGRVRAEVGPEEGKLRGHVILEAVDAAPWVRWASGRELPETLLARAAGTVTLSETDAGDFAIHPELKVFPLAFKTARFETVIISGDGSLTEDGSRITFPELKAEADDYTTVLMANDVLIDLKERTAKAAVALDFDVAMAGALIEQPDWYGTGRLEWEGGIDSENAEGTIRFRSDYLGYGSIGVPYGRELFAEGAVNYDISDQTGSVPLMRATVGETNWEEIRDLRFGLAPFHAKGRTEFSYDFELVAEMGYLKQGEETINGQITGQAEFEFEDEHATVDWSIQAESPRLELSTGIGTVRELNAHTTGRYVDGAFEGDGAARIASATVAGAQMSRLTSSIVFDKDKLILPDFAGAVFDGRMNGRVEVAPLREGMPLWFDGTFSDIDLAMLTEEVQPPKAKLTGIGDATITAEMLNRTLGNFTLQGSSNRDFTLNRTLVEEVLPLERMLSGLGQRQAERTLAKFLGENPQRPFDSAEIDLNLVGRTIVGEAHLLSEKTRNYNGLNLHINMEIDVPALTEALKMLEEGEMP